MVITNWRDVSPSIVHDFGIDYKLLKGQESFDPAVKNFCMKGMLYVAYAMLQEGKAYEAHAHGDHEEVYYVISGKGQMTINGETRSIRDGDAVFIPAGDTHSIANTGEDFLIFLAFSAQVPQEGQEREKANSQ